MLQHQCRCWILAFTLRLTLFRRNHQNGQLFLSSTTLAYLVFSELRVLLTFIPKVSYLCYRSVFSSTFHSYKSGLERIELGPGRIEYEHDSWLMLGCFQIRSRVPIHHYFPKRISAPANSSRARLKLISSIGERCIGVLKLTNLSKPCNLSNNGRKYVLHLAQPYMPGWEPMELQGRISGARARRMQYQKIRRRKTVFNYK
jgi:hypothetical protein